MRLADKLQHRAIRFFGKDGGPMMKARFLVTLFSAVAVILGLTSDAWAVPVENQFDGQVSKMSVRLSREMSTMPDVRFAFDMDMGTDPKPSIANLWFDINANTYQQSGSLKVKMKNKAKMDSLTITGNVMGSQAGKSKPMSFKIVFEDRTGKALDSADFLAGNLDPSDFTKAVWSINLGKGKKLEGDITSLPAPLMAMAFGGQVEVPNGDARLWEFDDDDFGDDNHHDNGNQPPGTAGVPEPAALILVGAGLAAIAFRNRRPKN